MNAALLATYARRPAPQPAGYAVGALIPADQQWMIGRTPQEIAAVRAAGAPYAPAGDALTDALGPLLATPALAGTIDRTVDRLGNILIDRFLSQPAVQREVGGAIGKAAVTELSRGAGRPYAIGLTLAAGISAASLLALAVSYALKK